MTQNVSNISMLNACHVTSILHVEFSESSPVCVNHLAVKKMVNIHSRSGQIRALHYGKECNQLHTAHFEKYNRLCKYSNLCIQKIHILYAVYILHTAGIVLFK